jgi:hypothetical protein
LLYVFNPKQGTSLVVRNFTSIPDISNNDADLRKSLEGIQCCSNGNNHDPLIFNKALPGI